MSYRILAEQKFIYPPQPEPGEAKDFAPSDLEILTKTWRAIVDHTAFNELIEAWDQRLNLADAERAETGGLGHNLMSKHLYAQLLHARSTLEDLDIPTENDPLRRAILDAQGPVIIMTPEGRVVASTPSGDQVFGARTGQIFDKGRLSPGSAPIYNALRRAALGPRDINHAILSVSYASDDSPPLASPGKSIRTPYFIAEARLIASSGAGPAWIALRSLELEWNDDTSAQLQQLFGLSTAETEVAALYFQIGNIEEIAERRAVSKLTVRTQLKSIMSKVSASSNLALMQVLSTLAGKKHWTEAGYKDAWRDPLDREAIIRTPNGRMVAWTWMGAKEGTPVVVLRGLSTTYLFPPEFEPRLRSAGIKLCFVSRPGYGNSSLHARLPVLEDTLTALRVFMAQELREPCLGLGMASGIVPLVAESMTNPKAFHRLLAVGCNGFFDCEGLKSKPIIPKTMARLAARSPWLAEVIAKAAHRQIRQYGVDWYLERAYDHDNPDRAVLRNPERAPLLRSAAEHLLVQGHAGFFRELELLGLSLSDFTAPLTIPTRYLIGQTDPSYNVAANHRLSLSNPNITVETLPGTGELLLYQRPDVLIERIIAAAHP